jgi:hypothetical protein
MFTPTRRHSRRAAYHAHLSGNPSPISTRRRLFVALALQLRDKAFAAPKLNVVAVNELSRMFECGVVVCGNKFFRQQKMPVRPEDVGSILALAAHGIISTAVVRCIASP